MLRICAFVAILVTLYIGSSFSQELPYYSQCDIKWSSLSYGNNPTRNICTSGSFITSLSNVLTQHAVKTVINQQPNPIYTPDILFNTVVQSNIIYIDTPLDDILFSDQVTPSFIESLSHDIHHITDERMQKLESDDEYTLSPVCHEMNTLSPTFTLVHYISPYTQQQEIGIGIECHNTSRYITIYSTLLNDYITVKYTDITSLYTFIISYNDNERNEYIHLSKQYYNIPQTTSSVVINDDSHLGASWIVPFPHPVSFSQCDSHWGHELMGSETICQVGCLMNSITVGIRNRGILIDGHIADPHYFNQFIRKHHGYSGNSFIHSTVDAICGGQKNCHSKAPADGKKGHININQLISLIKDGTRIAVANVRNGGHWVIAIGWNGDNRDQILVRDSASGSHHRDWYSLAHDVVGWHVYELKGPVH